MGVSRLIGLYAHAPCKRNVQGYCTDDYVQQQGDMIDLHIPHIYTKRNQKGRWRGEREGEGAPEIYDAPLIQAKETNELL